ncbi:MAG: hypothetical protein ACJKTH_02165 [Patescibacteria group bacterium UBA2163]
MQHIEQLQAIEHAPARLCNLGIYGELKVHDVEKAVEAGEISFHEGVELIEKFGDLSRVEASRVLEDALESPNDAIAELLSESAPPLNDGTNVFYSACEAIFQSGM